MVFSTIDNYTCRCAPKITCAVYYHLQFRLLVLSPTSAAHTKQRQLYKGYLKSAVQLLTCTTLVTYLDTKGPTESISHAFFPFVCPGGTSSRRRQPKNKAFVAWHSTGKPNDVGDNRRGSWGSQTPFTYTALISRFQRPSGLTRCCCCCCCCCRTIYSIAKLCSI